MTGGQEPPPWPRRSPPLFCSMSCQIEIAKPAIKKLIMISIFSRYSPKIFGQLFFGRQLIRIVRIFYAKKLKSAGPCRREIEGLTEASRSGALQSIIQQYRSALLTRTAEQQERRGDRDRAVGSHDDADDQNVSESVDGLTTCDIHEHHGDQRRSARQQCS